MLVISRGNEYDIEIVHSSKRRQLVYKCLNLITELDESEAAIVAFEENAMFLDENYLSWLVESLEQILKSLTEEE